MNRRRLLLAFVVGLVAWPLRGAEPTPAARRCWLKTPNVSIMTGFIYEPLTPYPIQAWMENLGNRFDADQWVKDFQEAGASHLVFYDKWIDGLVFHDTKTTGFKTGRDFVRELAAACQRRRLPLVFYFNAVSDGNPEFDRWATHDRRGNPIVFSPQWPTRYQTLHSPFREKAVEQVRELLTNYGPIHGIWHDIFAERLATSSPWVAQGYQAMYGEPFDKAPPRRLAEFDARTLAGYLDEIEAIRRRERQDDCVFTANGSGGSFLAGGAWTDQVGARLQYLFNEGHSFAANDELARMAWVLPKPLEINLLLNSTWFTPLVDAPPPSHMTEKQAVAAAAVAVCQGAGINLALTPGHSGVFGEDLRRAKAIGAWFRQVKPYVENVRPHADVGVVLGTPAAGSGPPATNPFWRRDQSRRQGAWQGAVAVSDALTRRGAPSRILYRSPQGGSWPESLQAFRAVVVPELAVLDSVHLDQLRDYVKQGGRLIAFGHASLLDETGQRRKEPGLADVLGVRVAGEARFPPESQRAAVRVDSEYNEAFGAAVLSGGDGEAWASGGTPMPHWVELTLPKPVDVVRVEVVNRDGPYQITDFEVETVSEDGRWRRVAAVRGAATREMPAPISPPLRTEKLRVKILRETYQGHDRQYADVAAIRVLDAQGHDWVAGSAARIPLAFDDPEVGRLFGASGGWAPMAVRVEPTTAQVVARLQSGNPAPAILKNRVGRGDAYYVAAGDGVLAGDDAFWVGLARLAAGEPTLVVAPDDARRYRVILTRAAGAHVVHVIDSRADEAGHPPRQVSISLSAARLGNPREAIVLGREKPLTLSPEGGRAVVVVQPDPVATIVIR